MISYYLEAHVVVRGSILEQVKAAIDGMGFWASTLTMDESEEERAGDIIVTTRTDPDEIDVMVRQIKAVLNKFRGLGMDIKRYKIEAAIIDSKKQDIYKFIE